MWRTLTTSLVCAGLASASTGCDMVPDPAFASLERTLKLRIVEVRPSERGDAADFKLELKNGGTTPADACLGYGRSIYSYSRWVDHPGCVREFSIPPGGSMAWSETLPVIPPSGEVHVTVQILNPRRCRSAGCTDFDLRSQAFRIP